MGDWALAPHEGQDKILCPVLWVETTGTWKLGSQDSRRVVDTQMDTQTQCSGPACLVFLFFVFLFLLC